MLDALPCSAVGQCMHALLLLVNAQRVMTDASLAAEATRGNSSSVKLAQLTDGMFMIAWPVEGI